MHASVCMRHVLVRAGPLPVPALGRLKKLEQLNLKSNKFEQYELRSCKGKLEQELPDCVVIF